MLDALLAAATGLGSVAAAATCHGRQVRLRREAEGIMSVDFRAGNGPVVEALWRRDRRLLWGGFAAALAGAVAAWWAAGAPAWWLVPAAGWAAALAFLAVGLGWGIALGRRSGRAGHALGGWLAWAALAAGLAAAEAWLLARGS